MLSILAGLLTLSGCSTPSPTFPVPDLPWRTTLTEEQWGAVCEKSGLSFKPFPVAYGCFEEVFRAPADLPSGKWTLTQVKGAGTPSPGTRMILWAFLKQPLDSIGPMRAAEIFQKKYPAYKPSRCAPTEYFPGDCDPEERLHYQDDRKEVVEILYEGVGPGGVLTATVDFTQDRGGTMTRATIMYEDPERPGARQSPERRAAGSL